MKKTRLGLMAALLCLGVATPALADWNNVGSVTINSRRDHDMRSFDFGGPVERLQLKAEGNDVDCRSVDATFQDGRTASLFNGRLRENDSVNVDVPGDRRVIRRLTFNCGIEGRRDNGRRGTMGRRDENRGGDATIRIIADVGRYREEWRRNPDFDRSWSRVFNWGSNAVNNWRLIGSESFEGRNDTESAFAGPRGRRLDAVALKPLEADARCSRVVARFDNGRTQNLNVNNGDFLRRGQYYKLDLPGDYRNLDSLTLRCSATDARRVTIQIFSSN